MAAVPATKEIRAHFDGKVIVPDEPVDLPEGTRLVVRLTSDVEAFPAVPAERMPAPQVIQKRLESLREMFLTLPLAEVSPSFDPAKLTRDDYYL